MFGYKEAEESFICVAEDRVTQNLHLSKISFLL